MTPRALAVRFGPTVIPKYVNTKKRCYFFFDEDFLRGTLAPSFRACDRPIAIACFLLVTFLPDRPLFNVPFFRSRIAFSTFFDAFLLYLAMSQPPFAYLIGPQQATRNNVSTFRLSNPFVGSSVSGSLCRKVCRKQDANYALVVKMRSHKAT